MRALLVLAVLLSAPLFASAELIPVLGGALELSTFPAAPRARDTVTVRAENVLSPGNTTFVWRVNGAVVEQGLGRSAITVTVGTLGAPTTVSVSATENGIVRAQKTITITPAEVDIVWEGNTSVPPFYAGLPLTNPSSTLTLSAVPGIVKSSMRVPANELVYSWYVDDSRTALAVGTGKSSVVMETPQFANPFTVRVIAETRDGTVRAEAHADIRPVQPEIVVYEEAPLLGLIFSRALGNVFHLAEEEVTLRAFPLYVSRLDAPAYAWRLNGSPIVDTSDDGRGVTFRKSGRGGGAFSVEFSLENASLLFERARTTFLLTL